MVPARGISRASSLLAALCALVGALAPAPEALATETDQYYALNKDIPESLNALNRRMRRDIAIAMAGIRANDPNATCREAAESVFVRLRLLGWQKIEVWAEHHPDVHMLPSAEEIEATDFWRTRSIYRHAPWWDTAMGSWQPFTTRTPTLRAAGVNFGADKLSHFVKLGWQYYTRYHEAREDGETEREALERVVRWGVGTEKGSLGLGTGGVFSFGDLEANFQGFMAYRRMCEGPAPYLVRGPHGWRANPEHPFDWAEVISPLWDESFNTSTFTDRRWSEVRRALRSDYCGLLEDERAEAARTSYRDRMDALEPSFSQTLLAALAAAGEVPDQSTTTLSAACAAPSTGVSP
ncbi:MAG: hypothetical protein IT285_12235 [Bdellovibrionales bacterium]|nr:hypothetical protein [Bdellovibrionales bacterium]